MMELLDTVGAKSVTAVDQYARNSFADVVFEGAELTNVKTTGLVVQVR
jgi:hypothetical protein